jgi:hypothetical protein
MRKLSDQVFKKFILRFFCAPLAVLAVTEFKRMTEKRQFKIPRFYAKIQQKNKLAVIPANLKEK